MFTQSKHVSPIGAGGNIHFSPVVKCGYPDPCSYVLDKLAWEELLPEAECVHWFNFGGELLGKLSTSLTYQHPN